MRYTPKRQRTQNGNTFRVRSALSDLSFYEIITGMRATLQKECAILCAVAAASGLADAAACTQTNLTGLITAVCPGEFVLQGPSGKVWIDALTNSAWRLGDTVSVTGAPILGSNMVPKTMPAFSASQINVLSHGSVTPRTATPSQIGTGRFDYDQVKVSGVVTDAFRDEIDPDFVFVILEAGGAKTISTFRDYGKVAAQSFESLIDTAVSITGMCVTHYMDGRHNMDRFLWLTDFGAIQHIDDTDNSLLRTQFPHREKVCGSVVACWNDREFYLLTDTGKRIRVRLMQGGVTPKPGHRVTVLGFLRKNVFFSRLINATCIEESPETASTELEQPIARLPQDILYDNQGRMRIDPSYDGRLIRLSGTLLDVSRIGTPSGKLILGCNGVPVNIAVGTMQPPELGSVLEVSGVCTITYDAAEANDNFVRLNGFDMIVRSPSDIRIVSTPPWWTTGRLATAVAFLLAAIAAMFVWNRLLNARAERRGQELLKERIELVESELRVEERTRLAVELHDSIAQNIMGVSLQLDTANKLARQNPSAALRHLDIASKALESCHAELRACIWDLRNLALEEKDMNEAIRRTVNQHLDGATLTVRFNVPRDRLTDNTTHALLRIIRELVTNAVRHGKAHAIKVAGAIENGRLLFSVSDDGVGFDAANHPGMAQGHFGLQGIRERIRGFNGTLDIDSKPGEGTVIVIRLPVKEEKA